MSEISQYSTPRLSGSSTPRPSVSSSISGDWPCDVFLNFRGIDTRTGFTGNLYNALNQRGIHTFIDEEEEELLEGEEITPTLCQAIQDSRIFISVFSNNYASSSHCLNELVMILECREVPTRLFLPVFYDIEPSQVRKQTGTYAEALAEMQRRFGDDKVQSWKEALHKASNVSGWHYRNGSNSEYRFIEEIVDVVSGKIKRTPLFVANYPVGVESVVFEVASLLGCGSGSDDRVNMVGIYGIAGIGKSTIARAVYNMLIDQFECVCYLGNVSKRDLENLQEKLLLEFFGEQDITRGEIYKGMSIIKKRCNKKKILLILDNVDNIRQLQALAGSNDWFGLGSRVVITSRNKNLLTTHRIVDLYEVKPLDDEKALELLSWNAFQSKTIDPNYMDLAKRAVSSSLGLPLALEVLGTHLFGKSLNVWESALDKYEKVLQKDIQEVLQDDDFVEDQKGFFLDMANFFNSQEMGYVKQIKSLTAQLENLKKLPEGVDTNVSQIERGEKEQYAPGVYIYFKCLAGGAKKIIKVRFRGMMFSRIQADSWWAENRARVYEHYNIRMSDQSTSDIRREDPTH